MEFIVVIVKVVVILFLVYAGIDSMKKISE